MTSSNGRPRLLASRIPPDQISMPPRGGTRLVCGDCGTWQSWKRGLIKAHPPRPAEPCPGSHQKVFIDITADQLRDARAAAAAHARAIARSPHDGYHPPASRPDLPLTALVHRLAGLSANPAPAEEDRDPREGYQQPPPLAPAVHQIAARRSLRLRHSAETAA